MPPPTGQCQSMLVGILGEMKISLGMRAKRAGSVGGGDGDKDPCEKSES